MSRHTVQLRRIVENELRRLNLPASEANWPRTWETLGLADYPIFDEAYRDELNTKIVRHYYMYEIGAETVALFRLFVRDAMARIMPLYNQMYESLAVAAGIDPLADRNLSVTSSKKDQQNATGSSTSNTTADQSAIFSDTPSNALNIENIKNGQYATTVDFNNGTGTASGNYQNSDTKTEDYSRTEAGYSRAQSELLLLWRDTFVNVDRDVIEDKELRECFMLIW